jgi:hypothetical protein
MVSIINPLDSVCLRPVLRWKRRITKAILLFPEHSSGADEVVPSSCSNGVL